jgi:hypothetical protein
MAVVVLLIVEEEEREEFPVAIKVCAERCHHRIDNQFVLLMELAVHERDHNCHE